MKRSSEGRSSKPIPVAIYKGTPWAVYSSSSGKKYFFNYETNISQWEMPRELKSMKASSVKRETHETYLSSFERTYDQELHKDDERHICPQPKPEPKSSKITVSLIELPHIAIPEFINPIEQLTSEQRKKLDTKVNLEKYISHKTDLEDPIHTQEKYVLQLFKESLKSTLLLGEQTVSLLPVEEDLENQRLVSEITKPSHYNNSDKNVH